MSVQYKVGKRIQELRLKAGLSQEALAFKADLDRTDLCSVENGKRNISIINLEKLAKALDISLKQLFDTPSFTRHISPKSKG